MAKRPVARRAAPDRRSRRGGCSEPDPMPLLAGDAVERGQRAGPADPEHHLPEPQAARRRRAARDLLALLDANPAVEKAFGDDRRPLGPRRRSAASGLSPAEIVAETRTRCSATRTPTRSARGRRCRTSIDAVCQLDLKPDERAALFDARTLRDAVVKVAGGDGDASVPATMVALWWDDPAALEAAREMRGRPEGRRRRAEPAAQGAGRARRPGERRDLRRVHRRRRRRRSASARRRSTRSARSNDPEAADALTGAYAKLPPDLKPRRVNALTRTPPRRPRAARRDRGEDDRRGGRERQPRPPDRTRWTTRRCRSA